MHIGPGTINNITFARAITKVAFCHAVAKYGLDGFRHLAAPDIILGKYSCVPYFVGSDPEEPPPPFGLRSATPPARLIREESRMVWAHLRFR